MLVIDRRRGQALVVVLPDGKVVTVKVLHPNDPRWVFLGIDAPPEVRVDREEVHRQRKEG